MNVSKVLRYLILPLLVCSALRAEQPVNAPSLSLDDIHPGQHGEVWTVFQGNKPEPFNVEVTGVIRNALGPGKSLILCQLTDPRVQNMGAVAGMSGSPLYINGKLAGALSYQIQRFETVRYAGFTPIADLIEVSQFDKGEKSLPSTNGNGFIPLEREGTRSKTNSSPSTAPRSTGGFDGFAPLTPVFALGGVAPSVASMFGEKLQEVGLNVSALGGYTTASSDSSSDSPLSALNTQLDGPNLQPGSAVAVALATGDITLAGTGTVSHVEGNRVLAFGHPLMSLGNVDLPMAMADIIAILPSSLNSFKISNTGKVIGTISQDRLSAIYGEVGKKPAMLPVEVKTPARTLKFSAVRHDRLTPMIAAMGLSQAVLGSNENGLAEGFHITSTVTYPGGRTVSNDVVYSGPQGFAAGLDGFVRRLAASLRNPIANVFPEAVAFAVEALPRNPAANLDLVQLSRNRLRPGEDLTVTLTVRDYQGDPVRETIVIPMRAEWLGKKLEVIVAHGENFEKMTGRSDNVTISQIRTFDAYLDLLRSQCRDDGLYIAVVERAAAFVDQTQATLDYPGSVERIARGADEARFQKREVIVPLWQQHILAGKVIDANIRRPVQLAD